MPTNKSIHRKSRRLNIEQLEQRMLLSVDVAPLEHLRGDLHYHPFDHFAADGPAWKRVRDDLQDYVAGTGPTPSLFTQIADGGPINGLDSVQVFTDHVLWPSTKAAGAREALRDASLKYNAEHPDSHVVFAPGGVELTTNKTGPHIGALFVDDFSSIKSWQGVRGALDRFGKDGYTDQHMPESNADVQYVINHPAKTRENQVGKLKLKPGKLTIESVGDRLRKTYHFGEAERDRVAGLEFPKDLEPKKFDDPKLTEAERLEAERRDAARRDAIFSNRFAYTERMYQGMLAAGFTEVTPMVNSDIHTEKDGSKPMGYSAESPFSVERLNDRGSTNLIVDRSQATGDRVADFYSAIAGGHGYASYDPSIIVNTCASQAGHLAECQYVMGSETPLNQIDTFAIDIDKIGDGSLEDYRAFVVYARQDDISKDMRIAKWVHETQQVALTAGEGSIRASQLAGSGDLAFVYFKVVKASDTSKPVALTSAFTPDGGFRTTVKNFAPRQQDQPMASEPTTNNQYRFNVLAHYADPEDDKLRLLLGKKNTTSQQGGAVRKEVGGNLLYTPRPGFLGRDEIRFTVKAGKGPATSDKIIVDVTAGGVTIVDVVPQRDRARAAFDLTSSLGLDGGRVELAWGDSDRPARSLTIERAEDDGGFHTLAAPDARSREFTDTAVNTDVVYSYRVRAQLDDGSVVYSGEAAELAPPADARGPNLKGGGLNVVSDVVEIGSPSARIDFAVDNTGSEAAGAFRVDFFISGDGVIDRSDELIGTATFSGLAAQSRAPSSRVVDLPSADHPVWQSADPIIIGMIVDAGDSVDEIDESDNDNLGALIDMEAITVGNGVADVNLRGVMFDVAQETLDAGRAFDVAFQIENQLPDAAEAFDVHFVISRDRAINESDLVLGTYRVPGVAGNSTTPVLARNLALPRLDHPFWTHDGEYAIAMIIDVGYEIGERNESDNRGIGENVDFDVITVNNTVQPNQPDLRGNGFELLTAPPLRAGDSFHFAHAFTNVGLGRVLGIGDGAPPLQVGIYLSTDATIDPNEDLRLGSTEFIAGMAPGVRFNYSDVAQLPAANDPFWQGNRQYFLGVFLDDRFGVPESAESNNSSVGLGVDFLPANVVVDPPAVIPEVWVVGPEDPIEEGDEEGATAVFEVRLSQPALQPIAVDYFFHGGSASEDVDYVATPGRVIVPAGELAAAIAVPIIGDTEPEQDESLILQIRNPFVATLRSGLDSDIAIIRDDDRQPAAGIGGLAWNDVNGNGLVDPDEFARAGETVYLDLDGDGQLGAGEPRTVTVVDDPATAEPELGKFWFPGLEPDTYLVRTTSAGPSQSFPNQPDPRSMHWPFDGPALDTTADVISGAVATLHGATFAAGIAGNGLNLDDNAHAVISNADLFRIGADHRFTIAGWFRNARVQGEHVRIVSSGSAGWTSGFWVGFGAGSQQLKFELSDGNGAGVALAGTSEIRGDNRWHHFAGVVDGPEAFLYVDGELEARSSIAGEGAMPPAGNPFIGKSYNNEPNSAFVGVVDEISGFDRPLALHEVEFLFANPGRALGDIPLAHTVVLERGEVVDNLRFGFIPLVAAAGDIRGQVTDTATGIGLPDQEVQLDAGRDGTIDQTARTDAEGNYHFPNLRPDAYNVSVVLADGAQQVAPVTHHELATAAWPFDESQGTVAADVAGGFDGILRGGAEFAPGIAGNAVRFDGLDDSIQATGTHTVSGARTYAFWVNPAANDGYGLPILTAGVSGRGDFVGVAGTTGSCGHVGQFVFYIDHWGTSCYGSGLALTPDQWNHVAVTYDGSGAIRFYVNGQAGHAIAGRLYDYPIDTFLIGGNGIGGTTTKNSFRGLIDAAQIYPFELTAADVRLLAEHPGDSLRQEVPGPHAVNLQGGQDADGLDFALANVTPPTDDPLLQFHLALTDPQGMEVTSVAVGDSFELRVMVEDVRETPLGVFSAYLDVGYAAQFAEVHGEIIFGDLYPNSREGQRTAGLIDEAGAHGDLPPTGPGPQLLFRAPFRATSAGDLTFQADPADLLPWHEALLYDSGEPVPSARIKYPSASVHITDQFVLKDDAFDVNEDAAAALLDVLANDAIAAGGRIVRVSGAAGEVAVPQDGRALQYTPLRDFVGNDVFDYWVDNGNGDELQARVTVSVMDVNDDPQAKPDVVNAFNDGVAIVVDVLTNDTAMPDENEVLTVTSVGSAGSAGHLAIVGNVQVVYTPAAGYYGEVRFGYTIGDGRGGRAEADVTLHVHKRYHNPNNAADVNADGVNAPRDVLLIINEINTNRASALDPVPAAGRKDLPYVDVDNDQYITPSDVRRVVNLLNELAAERGAVGESEGEGTFVTPSSAGAIPWKLATCELAAHHKATDAVFAGVSAGSSSRSPNASAVARDATVPPEVAGTLRAATDLEPCDELELLPATDSLEDALEAIAAELAG